jgi:hypothetical protein
MFPERAFPIQGWVIALLLLWGAAINTVPTIHFRGVDKGSMWGLEMRSSTERTAYAFAAALRMMMAPSLAPSAHDGARVGACSGYAAVDTGDGNKLTDELLCRSPRYGVINIDPRDAGVRVGRHSHDARDASKYVENGGADGRSPEACFEQVPGRLEPKLRLRVRDGNVDDLKIRCRLGRSSGDGLGALWKFEMGTYMFQYECRLGRSGDPGSIDEYRWAGIKWGSEMKVGDLEILVE